MPKFKVITIFKTFFFFTQICVMTFLKKGQEKEAGEHRKCESPTNVVSLASKSDCWPEHGRTYSERELTARGLTLQRPIWGFWFQALMVTGILHNSLPFGGWIRNALKTFCIRTAVMGKLHRGMLAATFKLHAGLRKSFFFFFFLN